jgi:Kef-type K+ transport system membrane component KefB
MRKFIKILIACLVAMSAYLFMPDWIFASAGDSGHAAGITFFFLAILLISAKIGGIIEKLGQPGVLGELGAGIILSMIGFYGLKEIELIRQNEIMAFFAELGAVILLFQIGLESDLKSMTKVGTNALMVALIGVVIPFVLGVYVIPLMLFPEIELTTRLFLGASLVATSVGITAYVFQEMKQSKSRACQTVLGAAVIDDILGLLILAIVSALATGGDVSFAFVATLTLKAFGFLAGAVILGVLFASKLSHTFSSISTGTGMKISIALTFALIYAFLATLVGLAPIVGAFAAGLILDAVCFRDYDYPRIVYDLQKIRGFDKEEKYKIDRLIEKHTHSHVEDLVKNIGLLLIPVFFVHTGLQVDFGSLLNPSLYFYALIISVVAIAGKLISGLAAKGDWKEKILVGISMVPRGEVGLIFASVGHSLGALNNDLFSIIVLVIIITTFISPPVIKYMLSEKNNKNFVRFEVAKAHSIAN